LLILLIVLVAGFAIVLRFERVKKRSFFYGSITFLTLALLIGFLGRESHWLKAGGLFLFLIFVLSIPYITKETTSGKRSISTSKTGELPSKYHWITKLLVSFGKYPRTIRILRMLSLGFIPVFFVIAITFMILGGILFESPFVRQGNQVITKYIAVPPGHPGIFTRYAIVVMSVVVGIVTLIVTFMFGLVFVEDSGLIGLSTGLWVGLLGVRDVLRTEPVSTLVYITTICVLCGYLGGNLSHWVLKILGRLKEK